MGNKFVVRSKKSDNYVITSLRIEKGLLDAFDELAGKSDYSRNELMCMALRFALENLEFIPDTNEKNETWERKNRSFLLTISFCQQKKNAFASS